MRCSRRADGRVFVEIFKELFNIENISDLDIKAGAGQPVTIKVEFNPSPEQVNKLLGKE